MTSPCPMNPPRHPRDEHPGHARVTSPARSVLEARRTSRTPGGLVGKKLIHPVHAATAQFRERFAREIEAAQRVGGFHTAPVVDADPRADPPWMVTAYIDGPSLQEAVERDGPLSPGQVRALGAGLAEGLAAIHARGLVHRDLKPGNVILAADGPRIIDFGISRAADAAWLTHAGRVVGSPG